VTHARWLLTAYLLASCSHQDAPGQVCISSSSTTLSGVDFVFPHQRCELGIAEAQAGFDVDFVVHVEQPLDGVRPQPLDAGGCEQAGASGLIVHAELGDATHLSCECDVGLCPPVTRPAVSLAPGDYPARVHLLAKDWLGQSDTGTAPGAGFPAGAYDLVLSARGVIGSSPQLGFSVEGRFGLRLVP
jgi:hypothetical protein